MSAADESSREMSQEARRETRQNARLVGVRAPYAAAPQAVQAWVEELLGAPVVNVQPRTGGMSPAVAASVRAANGSTAFVKAVGSEINPDTPKHFRHEIEVLRVLPPAPYRACLLSSYDDGDWVAIALPDVEGRHPDWSLRSDREAVLDAVRKLSLELTPSPVGVPPISASEGIARCLDTMEKATPEELAALPDWAVDDLGTLRRLGRDCLEHQRDESFCHWDVRHDNILIRASDGQPMLLDWGMSRRGPRWADTAIFALEWVDGPDFDTLVSGVGLSEEEEVDITGFVAALGCRLLMTATHPAPPSLPAMPGFARQLGTACLVGVRRRLSQRTTRGR